jgi:acetaldehyde dehydrogenase / alcohol dehydrogenase
MSVRPPATTADRPRGAQRSRSGASARSVPVAAAAPPPASAASPSASPAAAIYQARQMLQLAHWAAGSFGTYDRASVLRIAEAVAKVAQANAAKYAEWAVQETGFGVVEHKILKNEACSVGVLDRYRDEDLVSPRIDPAAKILALPRPAGVVLALTPSTNPVSSVYFKVMISLMTRNAIVVSPHPMARKCCADAARLLAATAEAAGAPAGAIQVVDEPTVPLIEALMSDPVTDVIVATGGTAMVRAAHRSGNPALGVGPGNVPVLVDSTADLAAAAQLIVESKAFDNAVLCTNESVLIAHEEIAGKLLRELQRQQAVLLDEAGRDRLRAYLFPDGRLNGEAIGKDATWIADRAGLRVPPRPRVLLAPIELVVTEEPFAHEKLCPVLAVARVDSAERGIEAARSVIRLGGSGHSAAIHSRDEQVVMRFAARVPVLRVAVNSGNSTGSAGMTTNLALSMTLGTGFVGHSSIGENLEPRHLVNWTRVAYNSDASVPFGDFAGVAVWERPDGAVPAYPQASNLPGTGGAGPLTKSARRSRGVPDHSGLSPAVRAQLRALIIEELEQLMKA